jgi:hypothetical protein
METIPVHSDQEWPYVLTLLPEDLEATARQTNALVRCRNIPNAAALIRMALAYAVSDLSLKDVAAWASALKIADITGPGLFYRLREAERWLEKLLAQTLGREVGGCLKGIRIRIVDATVITGPGSKGTDWRAHVLIDPASGCIQSVELTDGHGGEGYGRYNFEVGEVVIGDRAYATARGVYGVRQARAHVIARLNPHTIRVCNPDRELIRLFELEKGVPIVGATEYKIHIPIPPERRTKSHKTWRLQDAVDWVPGRAVAARTRKGEVIWVLTTLSKSDLPAHHVLVLYRYRWQIELAFKRLKTLLHLDTLPTRDGPTAKSWMLARFIAAALAQKLVEPKGALSPWGYQFRETRIHK